MAVTVLWFKRDLRVLDHPAMAHAVALGRPILPLYVVEPEYWALPDTSARQWAFTAETLAELRLDLAALGAGLVVRVGATVPVLSEISREVEIGDLVSHEETGNAWTFARDRAVAAWARSEGIPWHELPQSGVVRRLPSRDGWAAKRERFVRSRTAPVPGRLQAVDGVATSSLPSAAELGLSDDPCPGRQKGGRRAAEGLLTSFLDHRGQPYRRAMSSPLEGAEACSRLSPYLALGALSGREADQARAKRAAAVKGTRAGWSGAMSSFAARLAWRDHFMQKLEDAPGIETRCLHTAYEGLRDRPGDPALLRAWAAGETGLPFVDACMRALIATGWMNFRMRSMLVAVASYHLWLDWRETGPILARYFTDYEPGIHWSQMQMQSGTTGMNTVRIYNPIKQGHDQDPMGTFTRRWLPELVQVPDAHLQSPWAWEGAARVLGRTYPEPVVDVALAARLARERVWAVRKGADFRAEAQAIVKKHASRKSPGTPRHFQRDPEPRPPGPEQLSLDL